MIKTSKHFSTPMDLNLCIMSASQSSEVYPIKLNMVSTKNINDNIWEFLIYSLISKVEYI